MELLETLCTLIGDSEGEISSSEALQNSIFRTRKYSDILDKIILYFLEDKTIIDLINDTKEPLELCDLFYVLEVIIDAIGYAKQTHETSKFRIEEIQKLTLLFDNVNIEEEVLF